MQSLDDGEWHPGEAIPSENELALRYKVSQGTVRKAIDALAAENIVVRRQGKGTFVATHTEERSSMFRFCASAVPDGVDEYPVSRLIELRRTRAKAAAEARWRCKPGERVIVLRGCSITTRAGGSRRDHRARGAVQGTDRARYEAYRGRRTAFRDAVRSPDGARDERLKAIAADAGSANAARRPDAAARVERSPIPTAIGPSSGGADCAAQRTTITEPARLIFQRSGVLCSVSRLARPND
jgi:GntR family transcriptional regulator